MHNDSLCFFYLKRYKIIASCGNDCVIESIAEISKKTVHTQKNKRNGTFLELLTCRKAGRE